MTLQALNTKSETVRDTLKPWVKVTLFDGREAIAGKIQSELLAIQQQANHQAMALKEPRSIADQTRYEKLVATANVVSEFHRLRVGTRGSWPLDSFHERLLAVVAEMPVLSEENRRALMSEVELWGPRFTHLVKHQELLDPEAWFAISND